MRLDGDEYRRHDDDCSLAKPCSACEAEELERYEADELTDREDFTLHPWRVHN